MNSIVNLIPPVEGFLITVIVVLVILEAIRIIRQESKKRKGHVIQKTSREIVMKKITIYDRHGDVVCYEVRMDDEWKSIMNGVKDGEILALENKSYCVYKDNWRKTWILMEVK